MENKITISRSFSRKLNLGNYETADFFAAYSEEVDASTTKESLNDISVLLYDMAKGDVEASMANYQKKFGDVDPETRKELEKTDWKLTKLSAKVRKNEPILLSEWEELTQSQQAFLHKQQLLHDAEMRAKQKDAVQMQKGSKEGSSEEGRAE